MNRSESGPRLTIIEGAALLSLMVMFVSILIGVADRFALGIGLPWPEELARFTLVWGSLLSAVVAADRGAHFRLTLVSSRLGRLGATVIDAISIAALLLVAGYGVQIAWIFRAQTSPALGLSMSVVYAAVPVTTTLIVGYLARDLRRHWRRPSHDSGA